MEGTKESSEATTEGCINCEFLEYRNGMGNYCSEHERYVSDSDSPCENYVEHGCY